MDRDPITRRHLLRQAGVLGGALAAGGSLGAVRALAAPTAAAAAFTLTPEQEEGPFYVALEKMRRNITLGRPGVQLDLRISVVDSRTAKPIVGAACDIWQCDATGIYSDESSENTIGQTWLRGVQLTDAHGLAHFETIYPGFYQGRATHIHIKVHVGGRVHGTTYAGGHISHTGQLLFDDTVSSAVYALAPYTSDSNQRTLNSSDHVYTEQGGAKTRLTLSKLGSTPAHGYRGTITLGVNPAATPAKVGATSP